MDDKLCVVQFLHPGGEHVPDGGPHMPWNTGPHRRKFLINPGEYVVGNDLSRTHHAELTFWGEWEPQSEVTPFGPPYSGAPQYLHRPYYVLPPPGQQVQNTDPFVFGDRFRYTYCLQKTVFGPTQLQHLAHGSVILFGSCIGKSRFALDTVFIVDQGADYQPAHYKVALAGQVPSVYEDVTLSRIAEPPGVTLRLYTGATHAQQIHHMFSFFPCLPAHSVPGAFARPTITIPDVITPTLCQGKKITVQSDVSSAADLWREIVSQVSAQGLDLGIHATLPQQK